jgi:hypothetical protein
MSITLPQTTSPPYLRKTIWFKFQACFEARLPSKHDLPNEVTIDACIKDTVFVDGLLYNLIILNIPSYLVKTILK